MKLIRFTVRDFFPDTERLKSFEILIFKIVDFVECVNRNHVIKTIWIIAKRYKFAMNR